MVASGEPDVCDFDPGYEVTATIETDVRTLAQVWRGDLSWDRAVVDGSVAISGPSEVRRAVPAWLGQSSLAGVPRPA
jgi:hypothetical protein